MTKTPDLTAPEAVERFFDPVECALDPQGSSAALRALSAALAEMTRRRDHWKGLAEGQDFTRVYLETCAERDALKETLTYCENQWAETDRETQAKMLAERKRAEAAEAERDAALEALAKADALEDAHNANRPIEDIDSALVAYRAARQKGPDT